MNVLLTFEENEINFNSIPHLFSATMARERGQLVLPGSNVLAYLKTNCGTSLGISVVMGEN